MKPELTNLLHRLSTEPSFMGPFHSLVVFPTGRALACYQHSCRPFKTLAELEQFAYGQTPVAASLQGALPAPSTNEPQP